MFTSRPISYTSVCRAAWSWADGMLVNSYYLYRGTDYTDSKATFYAPLMEEWEYSNPDLLQRLRDLKDNLKYLPKGATPKEKPNEVREEFNWL